MPLYITLASYTQKGIEHVKDSPSRLKDFREAVKAAGGDVKSFYLTMGSHDFVTVFEAPDDKTSARILLNLASRGNVRTETMRAFTEDEYRQIISGL